jgi:predicted ATPase/DNA-binding winged helix-turn-helix (wHTH) protein
MESNRTRAVHGVTFGPFQLFATERLLEKEGEPVQLGGRALDILIALVMRAGDVVSKNELITRVWSNVIVDESSLRVHIAGLRKALGDGSSGTRYIVNVPGRGYCFVAPIVRGAEPEATQPPAPRSPEPSARLPPRLTRMVGRDELIGDLSKQVIDRRLVTLHGPGGIGKTTIAVALGHALLSDFDGAVCFVDLGLLSDPGLVAGSLASALGLPVQSSDPASAVVNFLRDRRLLLILDSCEHVIGPVADLAERIVQEAPQVCVVTTSRELLRIEGEYVHRLSPLQSPPDDAKLSAEQTLSFPATHLFAERAIAGNHQFELTDADAPIVAEICRKLDGIALAIELAAARVSTHGLRETAALLDRRMKLLWRGRRTASPRHQTMTAMLDWSYDLITEREQTVLRRLSVFVGTFTLEAAQAVVADDTLDPSDVIDALEQLAVKSLVSTASVSEASMRYRLLDTTRAYARAKLDDLGEAPSISLRHALYWQGRLERADSNEAIIAHNDKDGVLADDLGNIRAALEFSFSSHGEKGCGIALAAASAPLFTKFSLLSECFQWTKKALSALGEGASATQCEMELQAAFGHSMMFTKGNSDRALAALMRGLKLAEELEDRFYQFRLLSDLHMFRLRTGKYQDTLALAKRAQAVADEIDDPIGLSAAHRLLSTSHHLVGNQAEALAHLETWQPPPSQVTDTSAFNASRIPQIGLSRVLWLLGYPDRAVRAVRRADEEAINIRSPVPFCIVTIWGASVFGWLGDWDAVDQRADRLIAYATKYCLDPHIAVGRGLKGTVLINRGEIERGIELLHGSLLKLRADHYELYAPSLSQALAEGLGISGRLVEAMAVVNDTIAIVNSNGGSFDLPELLRIKGTLLMQIGDHAGAEESLRSAIDLAERQSALSLQLRAATSLARLKVQRRHSNEAREMLAEVYGRFVEGFDTADLHAARVLLDEIGLQRLRSRTKADPAASP